MQKEDNALQILGIDPNEIIFKKVDYHPELLNTWLKWKNEGLPEKNKKEILNSYNRKGDFYTEAPKLNLEIVPLLTDIAKKRDNHFLETQNCVGSALSALGAAVSILIDPTNAEVDEDLLTDYITHAGQILTDVYHQQSVARKSFITPQLNKNVKSIADTIFSNEWLYGEKLKDVVKDAKEIEKASEIIKERPMQKQKPRDQGNLKYPPGGYRQVGQHQRRRPTRFRSRTYRAPQNTSRAMIRSKTQSSSKK